MEVQRRDFTVDKSGNSFTQGKLSPEQPGPTRTSRALAMVHIAMYEAFARSNPGGLASYPPLVSAAPDPLALPPGAPAAAGMARDNFTAGAISGAALSVLKDCYKQQIPYIADRIQAYPGGYGDADFDFGRAYGNKIGRAVVAIRDKDGSEIPDDMTFQHRRGYHRPDPFSPGQDRLSTHWGMLKPFAIAPAAAIHASYIDPHPAPGTARYNAAVTDVMGKGAASGSTRTHDQTVEGIFWGYDGPRGLGVPPRLYNQVVRAFAEKHMHKNTVAENARLYALINTGMADAAIVAWSAKYHYDLWRPVVGIREHDPGFGPGNGHGPGVVTARCDPSWAPLGRPATNSPGEFFRTPDFPAYPSGHATFGAVALKLTALLYSDITGKSFAKAFTDTRFDFVSDEYNAVNMDPKGDTRPYHVRRFTLAEAVLGNALSRVWLGVHWRFDGIGAIAPDDFAGANVPADPSPADPALNEKKIGGIPAGLQVAKEVFDNFFHA